MLLTSNDDNLVLDVKEVLQLEVVIVVCGLHVVGHGK